MAGEKKKDDRFINNQMQMQPKCNFNHKAIFFFFMLKKKSPLQSAYDNPASDRSMIL